MKIQDRHEHEKRVVKQFDDWSDEYDEGIWSLYFNRSYRKSIEVVLRDIKGNTRILDIGCGTGGLEQHLNKSIAEKVEVHGIDISPNMIEIAKAKNQFSKNISFSVATVQKIPFPNDYFDIVFCLNSFHHYHNQQHALSEIERVMNKKGKFILLDVVADGLIRKLWAKTLTVIFREDYASFHETRALIKMLEKVNLKIYKKKYFFYMASFFMISKEDKNE